MKKKNIIVFAAHPDDELLGCGGTIKKYSKSYNIIVVFFTGGIAARNEITQNLEIKDLRKNCIDCNKILGTKEIKFLNFNDNKLDTYSRLEVIKKIEEILFKYKPEKVFTHYFEDLNVDHEIVSKSVITACRPLKKNNFLKKLFLFEVLSSSEWSPKRTFQPNYYSDITKFIDFKLRAMKKYKSEIQKSPMPRSIQSIKALARSRGSEVSVNYAEAFYLFRETN